MFQTNVILALLLASLIWLNSCGSGSDSTDTIHYVALGASDASGIGASPLSNGYIFQIEEQLDEDCLNTELSNLSIPGTELSAVRNIQIPIAIELRPDLVTLWPGPNDLISGNTIQEFQEDLESIKQELLVNTEARIFFATIPDLRELPSQQLDRDPDVTKERIDAFNIVIRRTATDSRIYIVELANVNLTPELINDIDGFHPSDSGHLLMSQYFLESIRPVLCG